MHNHKAAREWLEETQGELNPNDISSYASKPADISMLTQDMCDKPNELYVTDASRIMNNSFYREESHP